MNVVLYIKCEQNFLQFWGDEGEDVDSLTSSLQDCFDFCQLSCCAVKYLPMLIVWTLEVSPIFTKISPMCTRITLYKSLRSQNIPQFLWHIYYSYVLSDFEHYFGIILCKYWGFLMVTQIYNLSYVR